jgi:acetyltransferase-like isoleucine patch superfamily enzyme
MNIFKIYFFKICKKIYSIGKREYENNFIFWIKEKVIIGEKSRFYPGSSVINLAKDKTKVVIGDNCHIYGHLTVMKNGGQVQFGDNCSVGEHTRIVSLNMIKIGNRVMIAHNVNILDNNSHPIDAKLRHSDFLNNYLENEREVEVVNKEIIIEDDVWIGFNTIILKGVRIGRGAIIGAGSIVTKDIAPWTVNVGNPIRECKSTEIWFNEKN